MIDIAPVLYSRYVFLKFSKIAFISDVESSEVICKHVGSDYENIRGGSLSNIKNKGCLGLTPEGLHLKHRQTQR